MYDRVKILAKQILKKQQTKAPKDVYQYSFSEECSGVVASGSVYNVGDGYIQIIVHPSPDLLKAIKRNPGFSISFSAKKQQCQMYFEVWINTVATGQGLQIYNKYRRRNRGRYPPFPQKNRFLLREKGSHIPTQAKKRLKILRSL